MLTSKVFTTAKKLPPMGLVLISKMTCQHYWHNNQVYNTLKAHMYYVGIETLTAKYVAKTTNHQQMSPL